MITLGEILPYSSHRFPSRTALIESSGASITYQDLEQQVQQLAGFLGNAGIGAGDCIGIVVPKSIASVTAILACLQIGSTYIPADPQAPSTRNARIFGDARPQAILVHTDLKDNLQEAFAPVHNMVAIPDSSLVLLFCEYTGQVPMDFPDDLAYLLYTSGSTGRPKGVMISHGNALSFVDWSLDTFPLTEQDVFSSIAPLHFDLSIFDLFVGLKAGAAIVLFDQKAAKNPMLLSAMIETHQISVLYATPTLLRIILQYGKLDRYDHHSLRVVHFAGEVFPVDPLRKLQSIWKTASFFNLYGPTETNVVTWHPIPRPIAPGRKAPYPIGKSCSHVVCKLFQDGFLTETPGVEGELVVSGASVAHGYLNLPEKTQAAFFEDAAGTIWYRTGDIVRIDDAGDFIFMGRRDRMVKRRGYRIELGEVEAALAHHETIIEAGALAVEVPDKGLQIVAVCSTRPETAPPNSMTLMAFCQNYIPQYMLPDRFIFVDALPQTSTHKVDYQRLKELIHD